MTKERLFYRLKRLGSAKTVVVAAVVVIMIEHFYHRFVLEICTWGFCFTFFIVIELFLCA